MQYIVSAENTTYFHWQLELLIESFKLHNLEDNLVIILANNETPKFGNFFSNIMNHKNKFSHKNEGKEIGYLPLNRIDAIIHALNNNVLKYPFTVIHSDMILQKEIKDIDNKFPCVFLNTFIENKSKIKEIKEELQCYLDDIALKTKKDRCEIPEIPFISFPIVFNKAFEYISDVFFQTLRSNLLYIFEKKGPDFPCELAAWELTLTEVFQYYKVIGTNMSSSLLFDIENSNFIHYNYGLPPAFHKSFYKYENGTYLGDAGPYETLLKINITQNTNYMQKIIKSYLN